MQEEICDFANRQIKEVQNMKKILSLLLVLCLLFAAVPAALADTACDHSSTGVYYTANEDGSHQMIVYCLSDTCGKNVYEDTENCSDMDNDSECDKCSAAMLEDPLCDHEVTTGSFVANNDGTHMAKLVCDDCRATLIDYEEACKDKNGDGVCDSCNAEVEAESSDAEITCEQHGTTVNGDETTLEFTITGADTDDVTWTFSATGSAQPEIVSETASGTTVSVTVRAANGHGVARVVASASWDGGSKNGGAYVSFCQRKTYNVQLKDDVKALTFTQTKMIESIDKVAASKVEGYSIYRLLTDGCGTYVKLYEDSKLNERVADITYRTTGTKLQYDPDGYNTYSISGLGAVTFTVVGEGTYELKYEILEKVGEDMYPTTRGAINISAGVPGDQDVNMIYRTTGEPITFDLADFVTFWEDNRLRKEELRFIRFNVNEKRYGMLYLDSTQRGIVQQDYTFFCNLLNEVNTTKNSYELDDVTYVPNPNFETYTDDLEFMAYGRSGGVVRGVLRIVKDKEMTFADVAKDDWFYEEVSDVFTRGIMNGVSDTQFDPEGTLTRGMVVTMLHRAAGEPAAEGDTAFTDVEDSAWYAEAVAWAAENGIVNGMGDGTFAPDADITREQLAAILYRYAGYALLDTNIGAAELTEFADRRSISAYAVEAMTWAVHTQLMMGSDNYLTPAANATRAQAAVAFSRLLK